MDVSSIRGIDNLFLSLSGVVAHFAATRLESIVPSSSLVRQYATAHKPTSLASE